jgi:hypothetical protein
MSDQRDEGEELRWLYCTILTPGPAILDRPEVQAAYMGMAVCHVAWIAASASTDEGKGDQNGQDS